MFNSSLRRVARSCPNPHLSSVRPSPSSSHATVAATFTTHSHQRRNSSSKPPIPPNNGSPPIPAASVKQVGAPRSSDKRVGAESRLAKRKVTKGEKPQVDVAVAKAKDEAYSNEWTRSLPSVPSTQHLNPKDVYVASFFSTHRPISITGPLPPETSVSDIDKIFAIKPKPKRNSQDVIYTISSAVQNLEEGASNQPNVTQHDEGVSHRADIIKALTQHNNHTSATGANESGVTHLDGQPQQQGQAGLRVPGNVKLVIQALARQFRPFNPPPAPVAAPEVEFFEPEGRSGSAAESQAVTGHAENTQLPPLEFELVQQPQPSQAQATNANTFFTPSFIAVSSRRVRRGVLLPSDLAQIRAIKEGKIPGLERVKMYLISVKRQRRLKMKKHKYKKLQRKTRNLRRRQGKI